ncbi:MAG: flavocytochrome c [Candidatus Aminicenantes bacterium]|nr:flavocytochrome c [Candidatus Aminicenantes bacterium]
MFSNWDEITDVVVIGSGFAGLAASIEAHNAGASVIILEKMNAPGGNSIMSDGGIAAAGTEMQKKLGIKDSPELMYQDMLKAGLSINYPDLVRQVTEKSTEVLQWSIDYLGVEYMDRLDIFGGHSVPRCLTPVGVSGSAIIKRQLKKLDEMGIKVRTRAYFKSFIRDSEGEITGVLVRDDYSHKHAESGIDKSIGINKGIVLATGGFGSDVNFRSTQDPRLTQDIDTTNKLFATAEALKEALKINAMPVQLSHIQLGPWGTPDEKGYGVGARFSDYIVFPYGIVVEPDSGKRIINELADRKTISDAILNIGHPCVGIADARAVETTGWNIRPCLEKGIVKQFDQLQELASCYGISPGEFKLTVEQYNGYIEDKLDKEFGKQILQNASPISTPPYYGIRTWPKVHHTMGGVQINTEAQVIDTNQKPIRRLYAAGEVTGGIHGACRLGSCAITECLVFGRIAGLNAATETT